MKILAVIFIVFMTFSRVLGCELMLNFDELFSNISNNESQLNSYKTFSPNKIFMVKLLTSDKIFINQFPTDDKNSVNLILKETGNIFDGNTEFYCGNQKIKSPGMKTFVGFIEGNENSRVLLTLINEQLFGIIDDSKETLYLSPSKFNKDDYVLSNSSIFDYPKYFNQNDIPDNNDAISILHGKSTKKESLLSNELLELELAIETDTEFFKATGNDFDKAQAYILTLLTQVSMLYEENIDLRIKLTWVKVWTDNPADPYDAKGDYDVLRSKAINYWLDNYKQVPRDVYHVCTAISYGGGGFGYFNALCGNKKEGMSVTSLQGWNGLPSFDFSYDVYIIAHELGHNFNARHTHDCFWNNAPLDTCVVDYNCLSQDQQPLPNPGSIMSYCGGINNQNGFGYRVKMFFKDENKNLMRTTAEQAECISNVSQPHLQLLSPQGTEKFTDGDTINIRWKAYNTEAVDLYYSEDAGLTWEIIEYNVDPTITSYIWKIPVICSNKMLLKINSSNDKTIADTSLATFSVISEDPEKLVAYYPFDNNTNDEQFCHLYNAENINSVLFTDDRFAIQNSAVSFNGSNYLKANSFNASFDELTLTYWFSVDNTNGNQFMVGTNWSEGWVFSTYFWGQLGLSLYVEGKGVPDQVWGGGVQPNKWYFAAFTFDGLSARIYVDGVLKGETIWEVPAKLNSFANTPLYFGARNNVEFFTGKLDDVRIYNKALSSEEILQLMNTNDIESSFGRELKIYPNPVNDKIIITTNETLNNCEISLLNILGETVTVYTCEELNQKNPFIINTENFTSGLYFLKMQNGNKILTEKIIIYR
ncbi:MAG: LamG-like jellyroll fold domain-containing protein [bacterium]